MIVFSRAAKNRRCRRYTQYELRQEDFLMESIAAFCKAPGPPSVSEYASDRATRRIVRYLRKHIMPLNAGSVASLGVRSFFIGRYHFPETTQKNFSFDYH